MEQRLLEKGDVVQLTREDGFFGCFMVVTKPKSFGAQGYVLMPTKNELPSQVFYRASWDNMEYIGKSVIIED